MAIIRLTTSNSSIEANMIKNILENEEIECFLTNENFTNLMPGYNGMLGAGIQIMIDDRDEEKARELIACQSQTDELRCPSCNSDNVTYGLGINRFKKIMFGLLSVITGTPFGNIRSTYYCKNCKTDFKN